MSRLIKTFSIPHPIKYVNELQKEIQEVFPRIEAIVKDKNGLAVYYTQPEINAIEIQTVQNIINNFNDPEPKQDIFISGSATVQGETVMDTLVISNTSSATSDFSPLNVQGGMYIDKNAIIKGGLDVQNQWITNVKNPTMSQHATTKAYVDNLLAQRTPYTIQNNVKMQSTSTEYITYVEQVIDQSGNYRVSFSSLFSSTNTISLRLVVGESQVETITVHPSQGDIVPWTQVFNSVQVPSGASVKLQFKSVYGKYTSAVHQCYIELLTWQNMSFYEFTSFDTKVQTTSSVPVVYHAWQTPILSAGNWRLRFVYTYKSQNTIYVQGYVDATQVFEAQEKMKPYERKVNSVVQDLTVTTDSTKTVVLTFRSLSPYGSEIHNCYMELTKLVSSQ